jgi:hypothetical protein
MDVKLESAECFLLATLTGTTSMQQAEEIVNKVCDIAAEMGFGKILFDCFAVEGELSVTDRYKLGENLAEHYKNQWKIPAIAVVGSLPTINGVCARVAWNRGVLVKQFFELEPALEWLRNVISPALESTLPVHARFR